MKHLHVYQRVRDRSKKLYRCTNPDCWHTVSKILMLGKRCACAVCGRSMIISPYQLKLARIICWHCYQPVSDEQKAFREKMLLAEKIETGEISITQQISPLFSMQTSEPEEPKEIGDL